MSFGLLFVSFGLLVVKIHKPKAVRNICIQEKNYTSVNFYNP